MAGKEPKPMSDRLHAKQLLARPFALANFDPSALMASLDSPLPETSHQVKAMAYESPGSVKRTAGLMQIHGTLINRESDSWGYFATYENILQEIGDQSIDALVLDFNSGGGEFAGSLDAARQIRKLAAKIPVIAIVDSMACSAAYALACGASRIIATPDSMLGSIGACVVHEHYGENERYVVTVIQSGARKTEGMGALTDAVRTRLQATVDDAATRLIALASEFRGVSVEAIQATEAAGLNASEALALGLIDGIMDRSEMTANLQSMIAELQATIDANSPAPNPAPNPEPAPEPAPNPVALAESDADQAIKACAAANRSDLAVSLAAEIVKNPTATAANIMQDLLAAEAEQFKISVRAGAKTAANPMILAAQKLANAARGSI